MPYITALFIVSLLCGLMAVYSFVTFVSRPVNMNDNWDWLGSSLIAALIFLMIFPISFYAFYKSIFTGMPIFVPLYLLTRYAWKRTTGAEKEQQQKAYNSTSPIQ